MWKYSQHKIFKNILHKLKKKNQNLIKQYNITEDWIYFNVQCITYSNEFNDAIQIKFSKFIGGFIQRIINYCGVKG